MGAGRSNKIDRIPRRIAAIPRYKPTADQENVFMPNVDSDMLDLNNPILQKQAERTEQYVNQIVQDKQQRFNPIGFNVPDIRRTFREETPEWVKRPESNMNSFYAQGFKPITNPLTGEIYNAPNSGYSLNKDYFDSNNPDIKSIKERNPLNKKEFIDEYTNKPKPIKDNDIRLLSMLNMNTNPVDTRRGNF